MVGCNAVYGITLASQKGDVVLQFEYGEEVECDRADLKEVFKKHLIKKFLNKGFATLMIVMSIKSLELNVHLFITKMKLWN